MCSKPGHYRRTHEALLRWWAPLWEEHAPRVRQTRLARVASEVNEGELVRVARAHADTIDLATRLAWDEEAA